MVNLKPGQRLWHKTYGYGRYIEPRDGRMLFIEFDNDPQIVGTPPHKNCLVVGISACTTV